MEALWGRQVAAGGSLKVGILGHFGVRISDRISDNDFGGPLGPPKVSILGHLGVGIIG